MAVNTINIPSTEMLTLQPGERLLTPGNTADLELRIPATIQGPKRTESAKGRIWVTDQRIVFVGDSNAASSSSNRSYDAPPVLTSLVIPYSILLSTEFKLPTFSPNHILLSFLPDPKLGAESNLPSPGRGSSLEAKLTVGEGAGHGCWKRIEGERCRAEENRNQEEVLPAYSG